MAVRTTFSALALGLLVAASATAQTGELDIGTLDKATADKVFPAKPPYSPYAGRNFPTRPLFGDTHLHTSFSMDAGAFGARLTPRDAYRFARRRAGHGVQRAAGQALAAARLPGGRRSLGQHGLLPRSARRQAGAARRSHGPASGTT